MTGGTARPSTRSSGPHFPFTTFAVCCTSAASPRSYAASSMRSRSRGTPQVLYFLPQACFSALSEETDQFDQTLTDGLPATTIAGVSTPS